MLGRVLPHKEPDRWPVILGSIATLSFIATCLIGVTGGFDVTVGPVRVAARDPYRAYYLGLVAGCLALWRGDSRSSVRSWDRLPGVTPWIVVATAVIAAVCAVRFGAFVAAASDAYGYVSQAILWNAGRLSIEEPLARQFPSLGPAVAPLGYRLAADSLTLVPTYPTGLPLLMAFAMKIGGFTAAFFVVPILAAVAVCGTGALGTRIGGRRTGLMAAVLCASSPIFLLQSMQPMSDVPATAFWVVALVAAVSWHGNRGGLAAGVAAAAAIMIRPNLVPLVVVVGLVMMVSGQATRVVAFVIGVIPGVAVVALLNWKLYGSPLLSGYGANAALFSADFVGANLQRYPRWLLQTESWFVFLGLLAPVVAASGATSRLGRLVLLLFPVAVLGCYLPYIPFDNWPFVRFLLPAIPVLLVLSSCVAVWLLSLTSAPVRGAAFVGFTGLVCGHYVQQAQAMNIFRDGASQQRYIAVARYVDQQLPRDAVIITVIQSGTLRLYGHRATVRWDLIEPDALDSTIQTLRAGGHDPYVLLEGWEESAFRSRFAQSEFGRLDRPPIAEYNDYERVRLYAALASAAPIATPVRITP